ncbi:hypothetical protein FHS23_000069 [Prauserella isguenensis]|uniref:Uncharacterized protein n=1 Tax=Prauserella isguenensis TaxID=1470180 RepID=A0A839RVI1_9PSEU|nr:hypothetical protein [Prauserella isguenensis]MBB3049074.1 hypothetical protein [Prauserella isguenensis]
MPSAAQAPSPAGTPSPAETTAPVPPQASAPPQAGPPPRERPRGQQRPARRQRVALSDTTGPATADTAPHRHTPVPAAASTPVAATTGGDDTDEVSVRPVDGLGTFDLGSVPASVTPPSTWRRAAWFASLSSGAVVVAMLVAGTLLVGPDEQSAAVDGWPDRNGAVAPLLPEERDDRGGQQPVPPTSSTTSSTTSTSGSPSETETPRETAAPDPVRDGSPGRPAQPTGSDPSATTGPGSGAPSDSAPSDSAPSDSAPPSTSLSKPPPTPASTSTAQQLYFRRAHDTEAMAQRSQAFFDRVTEDPQAAHELTSGELRKQGPEGLERRYADIAYFEVEHIAIDQYEGVTDNTVRVTYEDGTTVEQTRRLTFDDSEKISSDGA